MIFGLQEDYLIITYLALIFGVINVSLLALLLRSYWKTYKEVKSGFTIGLLYFTSLISLQNIFIILFLSASIIIPPPPIFPISGFHEPGLPLVFINMIQVIALSVLYKITKE